MARRGIYRAIYSSLFDDPDYQTLKPAARLLLLTLRQCADAGPGAIFRYYPEKLSIQTGLSTAVVKATLGELERGGWIAYRYPIVWVRNGLRYDPSVTLSNPKHAEHIKKWVEGLPRNEIVVKFCDYYEIVYPFDRVSIPSRMGIQQEKEKEQDSEKEKDPEKDPEKEVPSGVLTDAQFIATLRSNPAYQGIDLDRELGKMTAWLLTPKGRNRKRTRGFIVAWLNRIDRELPSAELSTPVGATEAALRRIMGATPRTAGNPAVVARLLDEARRHGGPPDEQ